jgi:RND family efflux transporter MFP subunit
MEIRAPMAGQVLRLDGEVGEVVELGGIVAWVGQPRPVRVVAEVNEEDIPRIREGQAALILSDAFPGRDLPAEVASITPKGDPTLKTYRVYLSLPDDTPLFIGMSVDVNVVIRVVEETLVAPAPAVTGGGVFTIEAGRARRVPVETGIAGAGYVEITGGAAPGLRVISPVPPDIVDGARVDDTGAGPGAG